MNELLSVLDAPSNLGLQPPAPGRVPGVRGLAAALRATGLVSRLGARDEGMVEPPPYRPEIEAETGVRNGRSIAEYSRRLAGRVQPLVVAGRFPVVLGGDCSILLGNMLALRRIGRYGLFFVDGHTDFGTPATSQSGGAAGMDLALASGHGPELLTDIDGLRPLVHEEDGVVVGHRDVEDAATYPWRAVFDTRMALYSLERCREMGIEGVARQGLARLEASDTAGFWIHLDADVLDDAVMPAVDSRQPGGLGYDELVRLLRVLLASGRAAGIEITIYDPELDPSGEIARAFGEAVVEGLER